MRILADIKVLADSGYKGMQKIHANVKLLHKKESNNERKKGENQERASQRMVVENVIGLLKRLKIIANRYRNRCSNSITK